MRKAKAKVLGLLALATLSGTAFAGQTSIDMPVSINYSGGCVLNLPSSVDLGTIPTIQPIGNGSKLNPFSFSVKCTSGVNYTVKADNINSYENIFLINSSDSNYKMAIVFAKDSGYSQFLYYTSDGSGQTILSGTGDGTEKTITLYPRVGQVRQSPNYDTSGFGKTCYVGSSATSTCLQGTYTGTLKIKVSW